MTAFSVPRPTLLVGSGPDLERTLHSLLAQEVRNMPLGWVTRTALTDRRGRLAGLFRVHAWREGEVLFEGGPGQEEAALAHLGPYLRLTDTVVEPLAGGVLVEPGAVGDDRGEWDGANWVARLGEPEQAVLTILPGGAAAGDEAAWTAWRVARGIPALGVDLEQGKALPTEGGLETTHVSFDKGCFPGQEILLRLRNFGGVRNRLVGVEGAGSAGAALTVAGREVGAVTSWDAAASAGLAMVRADWAQPGERLSCPGGEVEVAGPLAAPGA